MATFRAPPQGHLGGKKAQDASRLLPSCDCVTSSYQAWCRLLPDVDGLRSHGRARGDLQKVTEGTKGGSED